MRSVTAQIAALQRELNNAEQAMRIADEEWRQVDAQYLQAKRLREELDVHKRELAYEIEWRTNQLAALLEAEKHERASA